jgi:hypothetical protein
MKTRSWSRVLGVIAALIALLVLGAQDAAAAPAAPVPFAPSEGATVAIPAFSWQGAAGTARYEVEVGTAGQPDAVSWSAQTVNRTVTPTDAAKFANGAYYWRVRAKDAGGAVGPWSKRIRFTLIIPVPSLVSPSNGDTFFATPTLKWRSVAGRPTSYKIEVSASPSFLPLEATYFTYNEQLRPVSNLPPGTHYWRVSGLDADGHAGASSAPWKLTTGIEGQEGQTAGEAFEPGPPPPNIIGGDDRGPSETPVFAEQEQMRLGKPAARATLTQTPTFEWNQMLDTNRYRLTVSKYSDFRSTYDSVSSDGYSYTPYTAGSRGAYANGVYYWRVEALSASNVVLATSGARTFTKAQLLPISDPADGAKGSVDPTFVWGWVAGAQRYRLLVSKYTDFHALFDSVYCDYNRYTPYAAGWVSTYPKGTYFWKVEAQSSEHAVITTSKVWRFTIQ